MRRNVTLVIVAGCVIGLVTFGVRASFGLFTDPLSDLRGWDREAFAFAIAIQNLVWGLGQPFAGAIADRYGAGRVLVAGGVLYALGTALMAVSTTQAQLALTAGVLIGLGLSGGSFMVVLAAFTRLVPEDRRSWSLGLATAAGSMGQFLFAPLGQAFISAYGPVTALLLLASTLAVVPILAFALSGRGEVSDEPEIGVVPAIRGALSHRSYQLLTAGFFVCGFHIAFITTHLPPYLTDLGLQRRPGRLGDRADRPLQRDRRLQRGRARRAPQPQVPAQRHLLLARGRVLAVPDRPDDAVHRDRLLDHDRPAVALDGPADLGAGGADVRHAPRRHAVRLRLPLAPDRRLHRRLARRRDLRLHGRLRR